MANISRPGLFATSRRCSPTAIGETVGSRDFHGSEFHNVSATGLNLTLRKDATCLKKQGLCCERDSPPCTTLYDFREESKGEKHANTYFREFQTTANLRSIRAAFFEGVCSFVQNLMRAMTWPTGTFPVAVFLLRNEAPHARLFAPFLVGLTPP